MGCRRVTKPIYGKLAITDEGLRLISRHVETGDALPNDKKDELIATKNFQTGLQTLRQMELVCLVGGCTPLNG